MADTMTITPVAILSDPHEFKDQLATAILLGQQRADNYQTLTSAEKRGIVAIWHTGEHGRYCIKLFASVIAPCFFVYDSERFAHQFTDITDLDMLVYQSGSFTTQQEMHDQFQKMMTWLDKNP